ncbi:MAG: NAD(P)-dependent oxidoreductase [Candidatus Brocadia sp. AMX2]|uniref:dTDP-4-dehydrorhamnose reductase n=1 Tax=Candidatus Brocadia sinica JPN1 TaxID=1197129 RepID=A0ABQ0JTQ7_9BACT|nr:MULTISPECIES: NAD(P)-dependent oxidoreductase [Brocadia]MBC6933037.1 NAD(P)-dependent oxidoreductase [Candidatus Brocadia sp.]MBL1169078.1 NAD(P)-dependent oxidoreductase [Candidatus Brocadia sp. AMX1]MCK6467688.1 NAD(P)-dependent oxidoreductase [Candidatus Brocadia sinica]NOG41963.1 NAD(P)-dependent oxidoreductase [Planctomycetota bacterium]KAA0243818.1 MAG: NAD(P)-dependent oxidoreductase [Candidatus Brocadia sp. AMX2]
MKKLLVTGASGFLGWNICQAAKNKWKTFGTVFSHPVGIAGVNIVKINLADFYELKKLFQETNPDAVIHTAANSDPNFCQIHRTESQKINVAASVHIAALCADYNIPCVFTSTDLVFNGLNAPYREEDPVCPVNFYGEQKVLAEKGMLKYHPLVAICRMALMFGISGPGAKSFIQPMTETMREGRELRLFVDEFRTPVSGKTAVSGIFLALEKARGLLHLGGIERISRYDFGKLLMETLNIREARLIPSRQKDVVMPAPRPPDVSLDSSKAFALGFKPFLLSEELNGLRGIV